MKKTLAILVALLLLAGAVFFIVRFAPGTPELSLTFVGFETNGAAKFVVGNHSSRTIDYFPTFDLPDKSWKSIPIPFDGLPRRLDPGDDREELLLPPWPMPKWRAVLAYERQPRSTDKLRHWLWQRHVRFMERPHPIITVASGPVPPR